MSNHSHHSDSNASDSEGFAPGSSHNPTTSLSSPQRFPHQEIFVIPSEGSMPPSKESRPAMNSRRSGLRSASSELTFTDQSGSGGSSVDIRQGPQAQKIGKLNIKDNIKALFEMTKQVCADINSEAVEGGKVWFYCVSSHTRLSSDIKNTTPYTVGARNDGKVSFWVATNGRLRQKFAKKTPNVSHLEQIRKIGPYGTLLQHAFKECKRRILNGSDARKAVLGMHDFSDTSEGLKVRCSGPAYYVSKSSYTPVLTLQFENTQPAVSTDPPSPPASSSNQNATVYNVPTGSTLIEDEESEDDAGPIETYGTSQSRQTSSNRQSSLASESYSVPGSSVPDTVRFSLPSQPSSPRLTPQNEHADTSGSSIHIPHAGQSRYHRPYSLNDLTDTTEGVCSRFNSDSSRSIHFIVVPNRGDGRDKRDGCIDIAMRLPTHISTEITEDDRPVSNSAEMVGSGNQSYSLLLATVLKKATTRFDSSRESPISLDDVANGMVHLEAAYGGLRVRCGGVGSYDTGDGTGAPSPTLRLQFSHAENEREGEIDPKIEMRRVVRPTWGNILNPS